jgi:hypothetical protein
MSGKAQPTYAVRFRKSKTKNKKYDAIINIDGNKKIVPFGDNRYQQYEDKIGSYKHLDHNDKVRRASYIARHGANPAKYSAGWFSLNYLW